MKTITLNEQDYAFLLTILVEAAEDHEGAAGEHSEDGSDVEDILYHEAAADAIRCLVEEIKGQ